MKIGFKSFDKLICYFWLMLANLPMPGHWRWRVVKLAKIKFNLPIDKSKKTFVFIGRNVVFDSMYPEDIEIGNYVHITNGCVLLTHYLNTNVGGVKWEHGKIIIEDGAFLGANTIITKPCKIGRNSIVGAGSVVTKDIPPYEVWAGNPAKFIKNIEKK